MGCSQKQLWGLVSRFVPDCFDWREDDRSYFAESMKRHWKDFLQVMVFQTWTDSRDATLTNWYINKKTYAPIRGDFEGSYFRFRPRAKDCAIFSIAKDLSLFCRDDTRQAYEEIATKILAISLDEYFHGTVFEGFPEWLTGLQRGQEILGQEDTYDKLIQSWTAS